MKLPRPFASQSCPTALRIQPSRRLAGEPGRHPPPRPRSAPRQHAIRPAPPYLCRSEITQLSRLRVPEPEHDAATRDTRLDELIGDAVFSTVALNPDLAIDQLHVEE